MTQPTQAQIEAAAKVISQETGYNPDWVMDVAKAVLTAAAQVGEQTDWSGAVDPDQTTPDLDDFTIERCAQVVEQMGVIREHRLNIIAAAIRKLKDEA